MESAGLEGEAVIWGTWPLPPTPSAAKLVKMHSANHGKINKCGSPLGAGLCCTVISSERVKLVR